PARERDRKGMIMKRASLLLRAACVLGLGVYAGAGCTVTTDDNTTTTGRLEAHWTISGTVDPTQCTNNGAVNMRIAVLDSSGNKRNTDDTASCSAFAASFNEDFPSGTYNVQMTLLAADGSARTTTSTISVVVPNDGTTASVLSDFPASSFIG